MKTLIIGNFDCENGPGVINRNLRTEANFENHYSNYKNPIFKYLNLLLNLFASNLIICSGISKLHLFVLLINKISRKKTIYLMHGSVIKESELNEKKISRLGLKIEMILMKNVSRIICVSEQFMFWVWKEYPQYKEKTYYVNNGIEITEITNHKRTLPSKKEQYTITSIGGGVPQKKILALCEAIDILNKSSDIMFKLNVIGSSGKDSEAIKKFSFVKYFGQLKRKEVFDLLNESHIYIQNSEFETFGLAVIEAIFFDCDLIISKNVGVNSLLKLSENETIFNPNDTLEISEKIQFVSNFSNNQKIKENILNIDLSYEKMLRKIKEIS